MIVVRMGQHDRYRMQRILFDGCDDVLSLLTRIKDDRVIFMVSDQKITIFLDRTDCDCVHFHILFPPSFSITSLL